MMNKDEILTCLADHMITACCKPKGRGRSDTFRPLKLHTLLQKTHKLLQIHITVLNHPAFEQYLFLISFQQEFIHYTDIGLLGTSMDSSFAFQIWHYDLIAH